MRTSSSIYVGYFIGRCLCAVWVRRVSESGTRQGCVTSLGKDVVQRAAPFTVYYVLHPAERRPEYIIWPLCDGSS